MPKIGTRKDRSGNLIFNERYDNLEEMISIVDSDLPGIDHNMIWFLPPPYCEGPDDLLLGVYPGNDLIDHPDSFECKLHPYVSLAQAEGQAGKLPDCDLSNVRIFWFKGELCMSIKK